MILDFLRGFFSVPLMFGIMGVLVYFTFPVNDKIYDRPFIVFGMFGFALLFLVFIGFLMNNVGKP